MPFDIAVKTEMFVRCNRRCCLCHKQCGINIEAAHIVAESAGGADDAENGIPVCFDCHQEIGSYNNDHPKGNKIRHDELRARRDHVYKLVAEGRLADLSSPQEKPTPSLPNPMHHMIDLLARYHSVMWKMHHAKTAEEMQTFLGEWSCCHSAVWKDYNARDDAVRNLADPAKEWLTQSKCPHIHLKDFDLVEEVAYMLSGFLVGNPPMAMPEVYSKAYRTDDELQEQWNKQGEWYFALSEQIARLKELTARAGQKWNHPN